MAETTANADELEACRIWKMQIELAEKRDAKWIERSKKIVARYRDTRGDDASSKKRRKFNILWSNVQTLWPALYAHRPEPIAERRFLDRDPVGRVASTILERAMRYEIEDSGFDQAMKAAVLDNLLVGRGQLWVRYEPAFGQAVSLENEGENPYDETETPDAETPAEEEGASPDETLISEKTCVDYVHWQDFLTGQARIWEEVQWVARRVYMGRGELKQRWPEIGDKIPLDHTPDEARGSKGETSGGDNFAKATVFEIWCKDDMKVHFMAKEYDRLLEEVDDPLHLDGFWPCPRPLYATMTNDTLIPVPDYAEYQDQAEELDTLTQRIAMLEKSLKVTGVYDASAPGLQRMLNEGTENELIPVNNWAAFAEKGGLDGSISWLPIKDIAAVVVQLREARNLVKQDLYEITGIADIIRGQSDPRETLGAQKIKGSFATQRLSSRQAEVARFARDVVRIMGEIIAEHFAPETLVMISGILNDDGVTGAAPPVAAGAPPPGAGVMPPGAVPPPSAPGGNVVPMVRPS